MRSSGHDGGSPEVFTPGRLPNGFSLVEIVFALLVLATGLLGLESLAIVAARNVSLADWQSGYARMAGDSLDSARLQLRRLQLPRQFCRTDLPRGDRFYRAVAFVDSASVDVAVGVIPGEEGSPQTLPLQLSTTVFMPARVEGEPAGESCS